MKYIGLVLPRNPISQSPEVIAQVHFAGGLNARQNSSHVSTLVADIERLGEVISQVMKYAVSTPTFDGPFELLLHLILKEEVDIHEVSLSNIVTAYLDEVAKMQTMDLDLATEFLLIAATLIELKTRRLLPGKDDGDLDDELALWEERDLLLARLLDCKTFKDVATVFSDLVSRADLSFPRIASLMPDLLEGVSPLRVQRAFMRATAPKAPKVIGLEHVAPIRASVAEAIISVADYMRQAGRTTFRNIVDGITDKIEVVVRFLAILELYKQGRVELEQLRRFGDIEVVWLGVEDESIAIDNYEG
jgi:segregation and condensation protein A